MGETLFVTFGGQHFLGLVVSLACGIALVWVARSSGSARFDRAVRWTLAMGCLASQAFMLNFWTWTGAPVRLLLPLHLCDVGLLIAPVALLTGNRYVYELLYFWGIGGAVQALLQPNITTGYPTAQCACFFLGHGLIVTSALYATVVMRRRPTGWSVLRVWLITNAYGLLMLPVNHALGTNYLFIMWKPATPSLLDIMGPWPYYLLVLDVVALLVMCLCYLPFFVLDWRSKRRLLMEPQRGDMG